MRDKFAHFLGILTCAVLLGFAPLEAHGQMAIEVSNSSPKVGDVIELRATINLPPDTKIYSSSTLAGKPTTLSLSSEKGFKRIGSFSAGTPKKEMDPNFEAMVEIHKGLVTFVQKLEITGEAGSRRLEGNIEYQTCDAERCELGESPFKLALTVVAGASSKSPAKIKGLKALTYKDEQCSAKILLDQAEAREHGSVTLRFEVTLLRDDLYIYATNTPSQGNRPVPSLSKDSSANFALSGPLLGPPPKEKEAWGELVRIHTKKVTWTQKVTVKGKPGAAILSGQLDAQICDAQACYNSTIPFSFPLTIIAMKSSPTGNSKQVLAAISQLSQKFDGVQRSLTDLEAKVEDNHQRLVELGASKSKGQKFDEVLPYHHSWDKGLAAAKASGKQIFVTFTGHFCTNCRRMENQVLPHRAVVNVLKGYERIVLHVDNKSDPEEIKNRELYTGTLKGQGPIPAYYILENDGKTVLTSHVGIASPSEFITILKKGKPTQDPGWFSFILTCIGLGLLTLFMPCTYPMIPITISVFSKGDQLTRAGALKRASIYAAGIIVSYTAVGGIVQLIMGGAGQQAIQDFANNGIVNLFIGGAFIYFAFSFFGFYDIAMPAFMSKLMQFGQPSADDKGHVPAWSLFLMGAFFMLTSYSCGAPFVLAVFEQASHNPHPASVVFALFLFSSTLAIPFMFLALLPGAIRSMPKSGGWFTTFKVTLGFFELAFALKFLSTTDMSYNLAFLTRPVFLSLWILLFFLLGCYLMGFFRFPHDAKKETLGMGRFILALIVFTMGIYLSGWFHGQKLEANLDALLPPHPYQPLTAPEKP